jgi:hypothetical protein
LVSVGAGGSRSSVLTPMAFGRTVHLVEPMGRAEAPHIASEEFEAH